jgi:aminopeptidase
MDERIKILARNLIRYSTALEKGEKILIEVFDDAIPLAQALVDETYAAGGLPFVSVYNSQVQRAVLMSASQEQMQLNARLEVDRMKEMQAYIGIRASYNVSELSDVPTEQLKNYQQLWSKPVHSDIRVPKTKWCVLRYPNSAMAQLANSSTAAFEDFYYQVCNLDYAVMAKAMDPLVKLMEQTDKVRISGPGTDLAFSIKDIPAIKCAGLRNIPDGEVYTAPVKSSVNGTLSYNTPAVYQGFTYEAIKLTFKGGKIIEALANDTEKINKVFDTDEGARFIGEFALGVNPLINTPMKDTLFDEKINGSFHFTPGNAYDVAPNGNHSAIHWDLVCIQRPEYGGGEIYFDDKLIRKNGLFVLPELLSLNPDKLK